LHELRLEEGATGLQEVLDLRRQLVDDRIARHQLRESGPELERLCEIGRTLAARLRVDEIRDRRLCPGRLDQRVGFGQEGGRESLQRIALVRASREESAQGAGFLRGHAHALAVDRIETAERVAHREQASWKCAMPIVVPVRALREPGPGNLAE